MKKSLTLAASAAALVTLSVGAYAAANWYGIAVPRATPRKLIDQLNRNIVAVLENGDVKARFAALGYESTPSTPDEFGRYVRADIGKWKKLIEQAGVKPN